jgi:hypothetical protein
MENEPAKGTKARLAVWVFNSNSRSQYSIDISVVQGGKSRKAATGMVSSQQQHNSGEPLGFGIQIVS